MMFNRLIITFLFILTLQGCLEVTKFDVTELKLESELKVMFSSSDISAFTSMSTALIVNIKGLETVQLNLLERDKKALEVKSVSEKYADGVNIIMITFSGNTKGSHSSSYIWNNVGDEFVQGQFNTVE